MATLLEKVDQFPKTCGVYLMKDTGGKVIYVGKAKDLRQRVRQYFREEGDGRYQVQFLMKRVVDIDTLATQTEKEALLLENSLIKKHRPRYNVHFRDDKTYISLKLTLAHPFPKLLTARKATKDGSLYFGPYVDGGACRETMEFIYRHFQLRTCSDHDFNHRSRPCMEYQIGRCTAPCVGLVSEPDYAKQVEAVRFFLEGKNSELVQLVRQKIKEHSEQENFEQAIPLRDLLQSIETTMEKQTVVHHNAGHQDLIHLYREGDQGMLALLLVRSGQLIDSRYYPVSGLEPDAQVIENFLMQHYTEAFLIPETILVSHLPEDKETLEECLYERRGKKVEIRQPKRGEKRELLELAEKNAQLHFSEGVKQQKTNEEILESLKSILGLAKIPNRIECYDISNLSGKWASASRVVFIEGKPNKNDYRQYQIQIKDTPDDFAMMHEVLSRRFSHTDEPLPDLLLVDGGKGQLSVALHVLSEAGLSINAVGIAKGQGPGARAKGLWKDKKEEELYLPNRKNPLILRRGSQELMLLQRVRDESHRFALRYHKKLREKKTQKK